MEKQVLNEGQAGSISGRAPYLSIPSVFTLAECNEMIAQFSAYPVTMGETYDRGQSKVAKDARSVQVSYNPEDATTAWVYERMNRGGPACLNTTQG